METERSAEQICSAIAAEQGENNILIDVLPETVTVDGRTFSVESNFRAMILFEQMVSDPDISPHEMTIMALTDFFIEEIPEDREAAFEALLWFYRCGYEQKPKRRRRKKDAPEPPEEKDRVFDYDEDAALLYAAFMSQYRIDLQDIEYMHWWKFQALFQGLHEDERIVEIIGYRSVKLDKIKDKDMRKHYAELKAKYALPDGKTVQQKIDIAGSAFSGGGF